MKRRAPKLFTKEFIELIFIPIIAVLSSYIVSIVQEPLSFGQVLTTFLAILVLVSIMHVIALKTTSKRIENILYDRAEEICEGAYQRAKREIESTLNEVGVAAIVKYEEKRKENELLGERFFSIEKLREIEKSGSWDGKKIVSVSCLTSTLKYLDPETENSFLSVVKKNQKKGVQYTYFYEDNSVNADIYEKLSHNEGAGKEIRYIRIPPEQFWILVDDFDFTIYRLQKEEGCEIEEICVMSTAAYIEDSPYHVIASQTLTNRISRVLSSLEKAHAATDK